MANPSEWRTRTVLSSKCWKCDVILLLKISFQLSGSVAISDHVDVLRRVYKEVSEKLEVQSVARNMFQCNAITLKELQSIQSRRSEPINAAEELLNIVMNQSSNVFSWFLDALKKTDHQQLYEVIIFSSYTGSLSMTIIWCLWCWLRCSLFCSTDFSVSADSYCTPCIAVCAGFLLLM